MISWIYRPPPHGALPVTAGRLDATVRGAIIGATEVRALSKFIDKRGGSGGVAEDGV